MKRRRRLSLEHAAALNRSHTYHGLWGTPTYHAWIGAVQVCTNPNARRWSLYGGEGIKVCDRWHVPKGPRHQNVGFVHFVEDMGVRPEGHSLDRIDRRGNFEKDNCEWVPTKLYRSRAARRGWAKRVNRVQP
jgi:hypothetical protein